MVPPRQLAALVAVGLCAAVAGFGGAAWLTGDRSLPPAPSPAAADQAAAVGAAPPEEALLDPPPAASPAPAGAGAPPETAAGAPSVPELPAPRPRTRPPAPPPRTVETEPAPAPAPVRPTPSRPVTTAPAKPAPPPPRATAEPPPPPAAVAIPVGELPSGHEPARRELVAALGRAAPGSTGAHDIRRLLALWRAFLGPDSPAVPAGRRATVARALRANAWWYARRPAPQERVLLRDPDGVILTYRAGQAFAVNPVATTGRWRDLNADVPPEGLAAALLPMGAERRAGDRRFLAWEYFDVPGDPAAIQPGPSAMAQARIALVMAHAAERTGDPLYAQGALLALAALTVDVDRGGVRSMVATAPGQEPAPWYVERAYPGAEPWTGGALNGFMVTLLNLRGAAAVLERAEAGGQVSATAVALARGLADRGAAALARHLADHDTGSWSLYGLLTPGRPWRSYLADLNYHCYHVRLLGQLAGPYPGLGFDEVAARWQGYVDRVGVACPER